MERTCPNSPANVASMLIGQRSSGAPLFSSVFTGGIVRAALVIAGSLAAYWLYRVCERFAPRATDHRHTDAHGCLSGARNNRVGCRCGAASLWPWGTLDPPGGRVTFKEPIFLASGAALPQTHSPEKPITPTPFSNARPAATNLRSRQTFRTLELAVERRADQC
jgi:hypothetical protein